MKRALTYAATVAATAAALTACSPSSAPTPAAGNVGGASAASTFTVVTADQVIAEFKTAKLPVGSVIDYTATTDPNHLLGRPDGYASKASWTDTRISAAQANDDTSGSVDLGGSIEVFASAAAAQAREQ